MSLTLDHIRAAADRLTGHIERTPCRYSRTLSEITGAEVWVKFENLQFTAAYKERGALNKLLLLTEPEKRRGVIAACGRQPRPGPGLPRRPAGRPGDHRHARDHPVREGRSTPAPSGPTVVIEGETYDDASAFAAQAAGRAAT